MTKKVVTKDNFKDLHPDIADIVYGVTDKMGEKDAYFFDIMTIVAIANCVMSVIRLMYVCYSSSSERALANLENPGLFSRILIKKKIRENTTFYRKHGDMPSKRTLDNDIFYCLRAQAREMDAGDIENILGIYKNHGCFKGDK